MPRRYFHRHWIKPHFNSLRDFIRFKHWWRHRPETFGPEREQLGGRLRRHRSEVPHHLSSHMSRPDPDLRAHLHRDLEYHLRLKQKSDFPETEHQVDVSER